MAEIGLEYLSVFGMEPVAFIQLARDLGLASVGLNMRGAPNALSKDAEVGFRGSPERRRAITRALRDTQIRLALIEGFPSSISSTDDMCSDLDHLAEMGALSICLVSMEKDKARLQAQFRHVAERAADRGMVTTTEVGAGAVRNLRAALELTTAVQHPHFGLLIDTMHFFRTGASIADFAAIDPQLIRHVQICDVPMPATIKNYLDEALFERRAPGDGDLPLRELVRLIPAHATIGLEIPLRSEAEKGVSHRDRLDRCVRQARRLWASGGHHE